MGQRLVVRMALYRSGDGRIAGRDGPNFLPARGHWMSGPPSPTDRRTSAGDYQGLATFQIIVQKQPMPTAVGCKAGDHRLFLIFLGQHDAGR
jgi:hypothetical protein